MKVTYFFCLVQYSFDLDLFVHTRTYLVSISSVVVVNRQPCGVSWIVFVRCCVLDVIVAVVISVVSTQLNLPGGKTLFRLLWTILFSLSDL